MAARPLLAAELRETMLLSAVLRSPPVHLKRSRCLLTCGGSWFWSSRQTEPSQQNPETSDIRTRPDSSRNRDSQRLTRTKAPRSRPSLSAQAQNRLANR